MDWLNEAIKGARTKKTVWPNPLAGFLVTLVGRIVGDP